MFSDNDSAADQGLVPKNHLSTVNKNDGIDHEEENQHFFDASSPSEWSLCEKEILLQKWSGSHLYLTGRLNFKVLSHIHQKDFQEC